MFATLPDLEAAARHVTERRIAIQAGANCGVWPKWLGGAFGRVYAFEPDPFNFVAFASNCPEPNIVKLQAALGDTHGLIAVRRLIDNAGASWVERADVGLVPTLRIDDLGLEVCDLIALDVEGMEGPALVGAEETIRRARPIVLFEEKHGERYGWARGAVQSWLEARGYAKAAQLRNDVLMVPAQR